MHLLMQRQWPCKFLVLAALSAMWGVRRTHWLAQLLRVEEEMSNNFEAFDAPCRPLEIGSRQSFHMMVTVSTGRIRLVVESYGSLVGGGTLFGRVLGYFLS